MINQSFQRLRELLRSELRHIKRYGISPRYDSSDVLQEACLQISKEYSDDVNVDELPRALIKKIIFGHLAKQHRFHNSEKRAQTKETVLGSELRNELTSNTVVDPQKSAEINELTTLVLNSIEQLEPVEKEIVKGRLLQDATFVFLADQHQLTVPVVKRIFKSACSKIKVEHNDSKQE